MLLDHVLSCKRRLGILEHGGRRLPESGGGYKLVSVDGDSSHGMSKFKTSLTIASYLRASILTPITLRHISSG